MLLYLPYLSMRKMWIIILLKAKETAEFGTNNSTMHGSLIVRRLKQREYCAVIDFGSFATPKLSCSPTVALGWKAVGYLVLKNRLFRLIKFLQRTLDLWESLDNVFTKQRIITFNRYTFLTRKQPKGKQSKNSTDISKRSH